ncbi:MAG TPA: urease accessory protein UreD [Verrucomicrobiae bacterium]|jgi:urease accessory protein|nr:urease accessory protein UreD [Verrucomicrobiae bacterium]
MKLSESPSSHANAKGCAHLKVELVFGESTATSASATSPLKLLTPCSRGKSVWAYASNFGGGLVAGDETRLDVHVGPEARCFFGTQASTKVYRNPAQLPCSHTTQAVLERGSLLVFAPDAVQAFAGSSYRQRQEFHLANGAGLALVDWFTSGRAARGERWAFDHFQSRSDVFIDGQRVFVDSILLDADDGAVESQHRTGRFNCFAMLLLLGPTLRDAAAKLIAEFSSRPVERSAALIASASPVQEGVVLRVAGEDVESVSREIKRHLSFLADFLGDDPWARKW